MASQFKVAIAYHSGYGHTERVAEAFAKGAGSVPGAEVLLVPVDQADERWDDFDTADAIVFGAPTYMGGASAQFKEFIDKTSRVWYSQSWKNKIAAGFTNSGSYSGDKFNTLLSFVVLAAQQGMVWVPNAMHPGYNNSKGSPEDLNRTGIFLGVGTQSNVDESPELSPRASDLRTAELHGRHVAESTARWVAGRLQAVSA